MTSPRLILALFVFQKVFQNEFLSHSEKSGSETQLGPVDRVWMICSGKKRIELNCQGKEKKELDNEANLHQYNCYKTIEWFEVIEKRREDIL